jgi:hypothetical protein
LEASLQTLPSEAVEFGGKSDEPSHGGILLFMREPRIMGTEDRVHGITYFYVTQDEAREIIDDLSKKVDP